MKSAEYRSALAAFESMRPTLERILKAAQAGAQEIETLEERQKTLEGNIRGLQQHEIQAQAAAQAARDTVAAAQRDAEATLAEQAKQAAAMQARIADLQKRVAALGAETQQATRHLADLKKGIEEAEHRTQQEKARLERILKAVGEAAKA